MLIRAYLPSVYVFCAVVLVSFLIDRQYLTIEAQHEREAVRRQVATIRAQLEGALNGSIQAARGLVATLSTEPDMDQQRFTMLAEQVMHRSSGVRNLAAARDLVINLVHPYEQNKTTIGLDYSQHTAQREAALRVRDTGQFILAGPVDLVQGGQGFIGRFPILSRNKDDSLEFWGLLAVVIDLPELYQRAGVNATDGPLEFALVGKDGTGAAGPVFFGDAALLKRDPISTDILFLNGNWVLYAVPKLGWGRSLPWILPWRVVLLAFGATVVVMTVLANRLSFQREAVIDQLSARERQLETINRQVEIQALHDHLTSLPNRRFLDRRLADLARNRQLFAGLIQVDLDGFKEVNDQYGHAEGDVLLTQVAARFRHVLPPEDFIARIGGDEFVVLCLSGNPKTAHTARQHLETIARRLIDSVEHPFRVAGHSQRIGLSAGLLPAPSPLQSPVEWLSHADRAMYMAKNEGRNRFAVYRRADHAASEAASQLDVGNGLLEALSARRMRPFYQPQFAADGETLVGAEALARWIDPLHGLITPGQFLVTARNLKVESEIDQQIFEAATQDMALWDKAGLHLPRLSVNVSFRRLNDPGLIAGLQNLRVAPERIAMELLESIYLDEENAQLMQNVSAMVKQGFQIEIDDFGTGFTSIVSLLKLRPKRLKIDRELVHSATTSAESRNLLATIVDMGRALDIDVCAEGIETHTHLMTARAVGCDVMQGYYLAEPMPAKDMKIFLEQHLKA